MDTKEEIKHMIDVIDQPDVLNYLLIIVEDLVEEVTSKTD